MQSLFSLVTAFLLLIVYSPVFAQSTQYQRPQKNVANPEAAKKPETGKEDYKVDITDIEKKYWAPKDTDFSVVQSRAYTKANRFSLSIQTGPLINDTFNTGLNYGITTNYFVSERNGFGITYISSKLGDTKVVEDFRFDVGGGAAGAVPDWGRMTSYYGINYIWVPIYAKMSLLGSKILYFDMALSPHIGITNYEKISNVGNQADSSFTYGLDVSQYFFLNKNWAIRADLKNHWYKENIINSKDGTSKRTQTNHSLPVSF
ncbi:MAG: outer membrane beta-barrel domain-containing protein [Bdellovibrionaceae bacterium]|nr:outer membrane beta-barrel domain-containing protein [Pseudobdellovibrionaceae bacterium]